MFFQALGLSLSFLGLTPANHSGGLPQVQTPMIFGQPVSPPLGYVEFCGRRPDQCVATRSEPNKPIVAATSISFQMDFAKSSPMAFVGDGGQQVVEGAPLEGPMAPRSAARSISIAAAGVDQVQYGSAVLPLTPSVWNILNSVNSNINARIQPMTDEQAFGRSNYWTLPLSDGGRPYGNCKHYAMEKRKALVDAGVPAEDLSLAIVKTSGGELHEVLLVNTDRGELVLDNLESAIRGWSEAGYRWLVRQEPGRPLRWVGIVARPKGFG